MVRPALLFEPGPFPALPGPAVGPKGPKIGQKPVAKSIILSSLRSARLDLFKVGPRRALHRSSKRGCVAKRGTKTKVLRPTIQMLRVGCVRGVCSEPALTQASQGSVSRGRLSLRGLSGQSLPVEGWQGQFAGCLKAVWPVFVGVRF